MKNNPLIIYILFFIILAYYLIYTIRFAIAFKKSIVFSGRRKLFHSIMIWVFPFVWISILKSFLKSTPGSAEFLDKKDPDGFEDNTTSWVKWITPPD